MKTIAEEEPPFLDAEEQAQRILALSKAIISDARALDPLWLAGTIAEVIARERMMIWQEGITYVFNKIGKSAA